MYMIDPSGVYLDKASSSQLRILGQQRMKKFGFDLMQNKNGDGRDFLVHHGKGSNSKRKTNIPLITQNGILMLMTIVVDFTRQQKDEVKKYIKSMKNEEKDGNLFHFSKKMKICPVLIMNEANLTDTQLLRLDHWRHAHRLTSGERHRERCPACEQSKHKHGSFKRNKEYLGTGPATQVVYWRMFCDGFGGQRSMGDESYQGAKGGFVFVCPVSGKMIVKLYATTKQFPAILYQVLQEVESEGYAVREMYVDTFIVNISKEAEDVAAMFKMKIVPVSAGTPQEMAYAERGVQTLAQMSRALMAGAPHLPSFCWGLSDLYAAYIHSILPQKTKGMMSPYESITGRAPNLQAMHIKVFGCACQYAPMKGAEHKRASKTQWGWYVGIQWPMALVLRPGDNKVISVSRKKIHCHEECYAMFDPTTQPRPFIAFTDFSMREDECEAAMQEAVFQNEVELAAVRRDPAIPRHVPSIKSLSDYQRNADLNVQDPIPKPPQSMLEPHQDLQGENPIAIPQLHNEDLLEEIRKWKTFRLKGKHDITTTESIMKALKDVEGKISEDNITRLKRDRRKPQFEFEKKEQWARKPKNTINLQSGTLKQGDRVKTATLRFGKAYALGKPELTYGKVMKVRGKRISVLWEGEQKWINEQVHHLELVAGTSVLMTSNKGEESSTSSPADKEIDWNISKLLDSEYEETMGYKDLEEFTSENKWLPDDWNARTILPIMEVGHSITSSEIGGTWPRDFYEALVRPDWRQWVEAVKDENESWATFEACEEVTYDAVAKGASVIPLGELFTIKRNGKYKFRQIALGNMLKEGKDYAETFASTISGDGIRWFCAIAASCGRKIFGWDAKTGYLQTEQRIPIYAYLPSHHGYSNLTYEELACLRNKMIKLLNEEGVEGIKRFSRDMRKERRIRPKTVLKLNRSIYGVPDAGQSFSMFMQSLHIKKCGMVQSELDPCIYYKIMQRNDMNAPEADPILEEFLLAITWVDDVRYFGTDRLVK